MAVNWVARMAAKTAGWRAAKTALPRAGATAEKTQKVRPTESCWALPILTASWMAGRSARMSVLDLHLGGQMAVKRAVKRVGEMAGKKQ